MADLRDKIADLLNARYKELASHHVSVSNAIIELLRNSVTVVEVTYTSPKLNSGSDPDRLPTPNLSRMIFQPVRNPLGDGGNLTMKLAPLSWQPSGAHYALESLCREVEYLKYCLDLRP